MENEAPTTASHVKPTSFLGKLTSDYLILYKLLYFMLNMAIYSIHTFQSLVFTEKWGLKIHQYGYIAALQGFNFFGALFWAHFADKTGRYKLILIGVSMGYALATCSLAYMPFTNPSRALVLGYTGGVTAAANFFSSAMFPLLDNLVLTMLASKPGFSRDIFGRQRMFGAFGHGLAGVVGNGFNRALLWALPSLVNEYTGMFVLLFLCSIIFSSLVYTAIPSGLKPIKSHGHHGHGAAEKKSTEVAMGEKSIPSQQAAMLQTTMPLQPTPTPAALDIDLHSTKTRSSPFIRLFLNPHFMFFMSVIMCSGYVRSIMTNFQPFYSKKSIKMSDHWLSMLGVFRTISEVGVYLFSKQLLAWTGIYWMLVLSQVTGILRVLGYGLFVMDSMRYYPLIVGLELLKGLNSGLIVSSGVRLANDIAPKDCGYTAQALFSGVYSGISTAVAGIIGGLLIYYDPATTEIAKMRGMFANTGYAATVFLILFTLKYGAMDRVMSLPMLPRKYDHPVGSATH